jgi:hypothetical protein
MGLVTQAIAYFSELCDQAERVLGPDHADTLASRNSLAYAYQSAGDLDRAILLYEPATTSPTLTRRRETSPRRSRSMKRHSPRRSESSAQTTQPPS